MAEDGERKLKITQIRALAEESNRGALSSQGPNTEPTKSSHFTIRCPTKLMEVVNQLQGRWSRISILPNIMCLHSGKEMLH